MARRPPPLSRIACARARRRARARPRTRGGARPPTSLNRPSDERGRYTTSDDLTYLRRDEGQSRRPLVSALRSPDLLIAVGTRLAVAAVVVDVLVSRPGERTSHSRLDSRT